MIPADQILANHQFFAVEYCEPWPCPTPADPDAYANVTISMPVMDAVKMAKSELAQRSAKGLLLHETLTDEQLLDEFIVVHWAVVKRKS